MLAKIRRVKVPCGPVSLDKSLPSGETHGLASVGAARVTLTEALLDGSLESAAELPAQIKVELETKSSEEKSGPEQVGLLRKLSVRGRPACSSRKPSLMERIKIRAHVESHQSLGAISWSLQVARRSLFWVESHTQRRQGAPVHNARRSVASISLLRVQARQVVPSFIDLMKLGP